MSSKNSKIYYKFQARDKKSDEIVEYHVKLLPEEFYEKALKMFVSDFLPDEILSSAKNLHNDPDCLEDVTRFWRKSMKKKLTLVCFKNGDESEIVAVNILVINSKSDVEKEDENKTQGAKDVFDAMAYTYKECNIFEIFGVEKFLSAYGLVVSKNYRGRGIATEMLKARKPLMLELGLEVTSTSFTGLGSQKAAKAAGFVENYIISYVDFAKVSPRFNFSDDASKFYKIMSMKI